MIRFLLVLQCMTIVAIAALFAVQTGDTENLRAEIRRLKEADPGVSGVHAEIAAVRRVADNVLKALTEFSQDFEFLMVDVDAIKRNTWDLMEELKVSGRIGAEPEVPDAYLSLFNPDTREALAAKALEMGVTLREDRVEVPGLLIQNRTMLEFLAVVTGGKEHEAIVALTGNFDPKAGRLPQGLAGMINACILALGFEKGTPVSVTTDGKVIPPSGQRIHLYVEWTGEDGEVVRARAEDLIYDLQAERAMARDAWVYVGSRFERDWSGTGTVYMADATGDVVATYSWPNTIVDNTTLEARDDVYFVCYTPRLPAIGTKVTMVFSKDPLPAKEFPEGGMEEPDGGGGK